MCCGRNFPTTEMTTTRIPRARTWLRAQHAPQSTDSHGTGLGPPEPVGPPVGPKRRQQISKLAHWVFGVVLLFSLKPPLLLDRGAIRRRGESGSWAIRCARVLSICTPGRVVIPLPRSLGVCTPAPPRADLGVCIGLGSASTHMHTNAGCAYVGPGPCGIHNIFAACYTL